MVDQLNILSRILAIAPVYRGFGFALLEEIENKPVRLVDWGVSSCGRVGKGACHGSLSDVIREARPSVEECGTFATKPQGFMANVPCPLKGEDDRVFFRGETGQM